MYLSGALVNKNMSEKQAIQSRIALTDFAAGLNPESLESLKGILLSIGDMDASGDYAGINDIEDTGVEPYDSYRSIGVAMVRWQRQVMESARGMNVN